MKKRLLVLLLSLSSFVMSFPVNGSYLSNSEALARIKRLSIDKQWNDQQLYDWLAQLSPDASVLSKISKPAEKTKPWYQYKKIFLDQSRIDNGVLFFKTHHQWLDEAYKKYGVDPYVIVAIIGVETRYAKVTGDTQTFNALATLCFDYPPRADFFCTQFDDFIQLSYQQGWDPLTVKGSYAGAMGMAQFMPSSYLNDAIDFDQDGEIDLWQSPADAIGSIAHYLYNRKWQRNGEIVFSINKLLIESSSNKLALTMPLNLKLIQWMGRISVKDLAILRLQGESGTLYWLTKHNFSVIRKYNQSPMYAMAVYELAEKIKKKVEIK